MIFLNLSLVKAKVHNRVLVYLKESFLSLIIIWYLLSLIGGHQYFGGLRDQMVLLGAT